MDIQNKVALITGVSKGIGRATATEFIERGAVVVGWGRNRPDIEHNNFHFFECDVRFPEQIDRALEQTIAAVGQQVSVLVNNAGLGRAGAVDEQSIDEWKLMFDTNVHGMFFVTRKIVPLMKQMGEGHIVNIASIAGTNGIEMMSGYCGTKHAVRGMSHSWMKELRNDGIKVTAIYPGSTQTEFFVEIPGMDAHNHMMRPEDIAQSIAEVVNTHGNYLAVDLEIRPLKPKG